MNVRTLLAVSATSLLAACAGRAAAPRAVAPAPAPAPVAVAPAVVPVPAAVPAAPPATSAPAPAAWSAATPVGRIVAERPSAARVLERAGIDYCCGGTVSLGDAVRARGGAVSLAALLGELAAVREAPAPATDRSFTDVPLPEVLRYIEATHHGFLRTELPRLAPIVEKVRGVHGTAHPELEEVATLFATLERDLPPHLELEERRLFPAIVALDAGRATSSLDRLDVLEALALMEAQHDGAGAALHRLRALTKGYAVPADACASYTQLLTGLAALEADLHAHVHLENNVLAPRVQALARR